MAKQSKPETLTDEQWIALEADYIASTGVDYRDALALAKRNVKNRDRYDKRRAEFAERTFSL